MLFLKGFSDLFLFDNNKGCKYAIDFCLVGFFLKGCPDVLGAILHPSFTVVFEQNNSHFFYSNSPVTRGITLQILQRSS